VRTSEAEIAFRRYLADRGLSVDHLTAEAAVEEAIRFFEAERADDVEDVQGDMLLFQWGTYDWQHGKGPSFQFEMARQFVVAGFEPEDADDAMWQLRLTLHYAPFDAGTSVGAGDQWCTNVENVGEFRAFIRGTEAFTFAMANRPDRIELSLDQVG
jgi:hypothetical protein